MNPELGFELVRMMLAERRSSLGGRAGPWSSAAKTGTRKTLGTAGYRERREAGHRPGEVGVRQETYQ